MAEKFDLDIDKAPRPVDHDGSTHLPHYDNAVVEEENTYAYDDSRKLGITGSVFLILNKMIGTGSTSITTHIPAMAYIHLSFLYTLWNLRGNWIGGRVLVFMGNRYVT